MQHISNSISNIEQSRGIGPANPTISGGRVSSPAHRYALEQCDDFTGLEENTKRYDLLLLVKRAGKLIGFTPRMVELLDYYMSYTRDIDWGQGARPIIYQSIAKTALDLGVSERHIQRLEQHMFDLGALTWNDSGNHRRYGQRDPKSGAILYAYGVDLTPLAYLKGELEDKYHEKQQRDQAWMELKRQISWYRRQIRASLAEYEQNIDLFAQGGVGELLKFTNRYEMIAKPIRTSMGMDVLSSLLAEHKDLHAVVTAYIEANPSNESADKTTKSMEITQKESSNDDSEVAYYKYSTQKQSNKLDKQNCMASPNSSQEICSRVSVEGGAKAVIADTGLEHITLKQSLNAASARFRDSIPMANRPMNWADIVDAAYVLRKELHIPQDFWGEACSVLGRTGAAICIILTDQATLREVDPVARPAAYFKAMINRARTGELHLHSSIFGILKREDEDVVE